VVAGVPVIERSYAPGEQVYLRGDADRGLCFLLEGTIRLYKVYGSFQEATLGLLEDGGLFGEPSLQPEGRHRDSAEAVSYCRVIRAPKGPLEAHFRRDPLCRAALIRALGEWAEERETAVARLQARRIGGRLARLLLELAGRFGRETDRGTVGWMRLTHQDLARMIACARGRVDVLVDNAAAVYLASEEAAFVHGVDIPPTYTLDQ
jgi:CRP-like cAMP-binding protein